MAAGVVLHHSTPRYKVGSRPSLPLGPSAPTGIMGQQRAGLGASNDVPTPQSHIRDLLKRDISLVKVIQVMLVRRVLPCQCRPLRMWEFNRKDQEPFNTSSA